MPNQSLTDLPERTTTSGSDRIHVNNAGTDYQQTKDDFLRGDLLHTFSNTTSLTSQVDALPNGTYYGSCSAGGHQSETGAPVNAIGYVEVQKIGSNNAILYFTVVSTGDRYFKKKASGTWDSAWTQDPTRAEITSLNNSLANSLKLGDWTANLTLPYTPTSDGFISVWLNPSSTSGAYARLSVTGDSHAMGLNAKGGDGVTLVFPIKKNATVSQVALSNGTLSVRFISIFG